MEVFVIAIVLVTALVIGTEHKQGDPDRSHAIETGSTQDQPVDREPPARVCDPDHNHIIQRDLTKSGNRQVNDDDH